MIRLNYDSNYDLNYFSNYPRDPGSYQINHTRNKVHPPAAVAVLASTAAGCPSAAAAKRKKCSRGLTGSDWINCSFGSMTDLPCWGLKLSNRPALLPKLSARHPGQSGSNFGEQTCCPLMAMTYLGRTMLTVEWLQARGYGWNLPLDSNNQNWCPLGIHCGCRTRYQAIRTLAKIYRNPTKYVIAYRILQILWYSLLLYIYGRVLCKLAEKIQKFIGAYFET